MSDPADDLFLELADEARLGGKARSLARLREAGLRVPPGFALADGLFAGLVGSLVAAETSDPAPGRPAAPSNDQPSASPSPSASAKRPPLPAGSAHAAAEAIARAAWPAGFSAALQQRLRALGSGPFSVRSSFAAEDDPASVAAGIYRSRTAVAAAGVESAVRQVLASAVAPAAAAYAAARGHGLAGPPVSVLIHPYRAGDRSGGAAWDPAAPHQPPIIDARGGPPSAPVRATVEAALRTLAAHFGAVEIEWVAEGDEVTFLQLRPYRAPPPVRPWAGQRDLPPGPDWRWDAAHNPLPLTPAQAGLVALVDAAGGIGFRQHVARGYLFWAPGGTAPARRIPPAALPAELARIEREVEAALTALGHPPALEPALQTFATFYQPIYGVLRPAIHQARAALIDLLPPQDPPATPPPPPSTDSPERTSATPQPTPSHASPESTSALSQLPILLADVESRAQQRRQMASQIADAATADERQRAIDAYLAVFGDESPIWDVAAPTHRERPQDLADRLSRAARTAAAPPDWRSAAQQARSRLPEPLREPWDTALAQARAAAAAAEDDDWIYARLQAAVRRALLHLGAQLTATAQLDHPDDIFYVPLPTTRSLAPTPPSDGDLLPQPPSPPTSPTTEPIPASTSRPPPPATAAPPPAPPPLRALVAAGRAAHAAALRDPPPLPRERAGLGSGPLLRGHGTGGRALGRIHHHDPAGPPPPPDAILVATTLLPTELPLLQVAALITETGGPLDHVATQARERGLPAITAVPNALTHLPPGTLVLVDADTGLIIPAHSLE